MSCVLSYQAHVSDRCQHRYDSNVLLPDHLGGRGEREKREKGEKGRGREKGGGRRGRGREREKGRGRGRGREEGEGETACKAAVNRLQRALNAPSCSEATGIR